MSFWVASVSDECEDACDSADAATAASTADAVGLGGVDLNPHTVLVKDCDPSLEFHCNEIATRSRLSGPNCNS